MAKQIRVEDLREECREIVRRLENEPLGRPLDACVQPVRDGFASNFAAQSGSDGAKWPERTTGGDHPLLIESGALLGAVQGGQGGITRNQDRQLALGVEKLDGIGGLPGAGVHNFGYPYNNIPQREFLYATEDVLAKCDEIIADGAVSEIFVF
jgi:hypothetical protein